MSGHTFYTGGSSVRGRMRGYRSKGFMPTRIQGARMTVSGRRYYAGGSSVKGRMHHRLSRDPTPSHTFRIGEFKVDREDFVKKLMETTKDPKSGRLVYAQQDREELAKQLQLSDGKTQEMEYVRSMMAADADAYKAQKLDILLGIFKGTDLIKSYPGPYGTDEEPRQMADLLKAFDLGWNSFVTGPKYKSATNQDLRTSQQHKIMSACVKFFGSGNPIKYLDVNPGVGIRALVAAMFIEVRRYFYAPLMVNMGDSENAYLSNVEARLVHERNVVAILQHLRTKKVEAVTTTSVVDKTGGEAQKTPILREKDYPLDFLPEEAAIDVNLKYKFKKNPNFREGETSALIPNERYSPLWKAVSGFEFLKEATDCDVNLIQVTMDRELHNHLVEGTNTILQGLDYLYHRAVGCQRGGLIVFVLPYYQPDGKSLYAPSILGDIRKAKTADGVHIGDKFFVAVSPYKHSMAYFVGISIEKRTSGRYELNRASDAAAKFLAEFVDSTSKHPSYYELTGRNFHQFRPMGERATSLDSDKSSVRDNSLVADLANAPPSKKDLSLGRKFQNHNFVNRFQYTVLPDKSLLKRCADELSVNDTLWGYKNLKYTQIRNPDNESQSKYVLAALLDEQYFTGVGIPPVKDEYNPDQIAYAVHAYLKTGTDAKRKGFIGHRLGMVNVGPQTVESQEPFARWWGAVAPIALLYRTVHEKDDTKNVAEDMHQKLSQRAFDVYYDDSRRVKTRKGIKERLVWVFHPAAQRVSLEFDWGRTHAPLVENRGETESLSKKLAQAADRMQTPKRAWEDSGLTAASSDYREARSHSMAFVNYQVNHTAWGPECALIQSAVRLLEEHVKRTSLKSLPDREKIYLRQEKNDGKTSPRSEYLVVTFVVKRPGSKIHGPHPTHNTARDDILAKLGVSKSGSNAWKWESQTLHDAYNAGRYLLYVYNVDANVSIVFAVAAVNMTEHYLLTPVGTKGKSWGPATTAAEFISRIEGFLPRRDEDQPRRIVDAINTIELQTMREAEAINTQKAKEFEDILTKKLEARDAALEAEKDEGKSYRFLSDDKKTIRSIRTSTMSEAPADVLEVLYNLSAQLLEQAKVERNHLTFVSWDAGSADTTARLSRNWATIWDGVVKRDQKRWTNPELNLASLGRRYLLRRAMCAKDVQNLVTNIYSKTDFAKVSISEDSAGRTLYTDDLDYTKELRWMILSNSSEKTKQEKNYEPGPVGCVYMGMNWDTWNPAAPKLFRAGASIMSDHLSRSDDEQAAQGFSDVLIVATVVQMGDAFDKQHHGNMSERAVSILSGQEGDDESVLRNAIKERRYRLVSSDFTHVIPSGDSFVTVKRQLIIGIGFSNRIWKGGDGLEGSNTIFSAEVDGPAFANSNAVAYDSDARSPIHLRSLVDLPSSAREKESAAVLRVLEKEESWSSLSPSSSSSSSSSSAPLEEKADASKQVPTVVRDRSKKRKNFKQVTNEADVLVKYQAYLDAFYKARGLSDDPATPVKIGEHVADARHQYEERLQWVARETSKLHTGYDDSLERRGSENFLLIRATMLELSWTAREVLAAVNSAVGSEALGQENLAWFQVRVCVFYLLRVLPKAEKLPADLFSFWIQRDTDTLKEEMKELLRRCSDILKAEQGLLVTAYTRDDGKVVRELKKKSDDEVDNAIYAHQASIMDGKKFLAMHRAADSLALQHEDDKPAFSHLLL